MTKKIDWHFLENFSDPEVFQQAYEWLESKGPELTLVKSDQDEHRLSLPFENLADSWVRFGKKFIQKYSCECAKSDRSLCVHLLAIAILYRRGENQSNTPYESSRENLPTRISIPAILHQIPKEDLDRFIQRYARTNKAFGQALKLHFASKIQVQSPEQKYHDLIRSMARLQPLVNGKLPKQALQSLYWLTEELLLQVDDLIALETSLEGLAICIELLSKYQSIYRKLDLYIGEFEKNWIQIHHRLKSLFELNVAPDLQQTSFQKLMQLFSDPGHPFLHSPCNLFEIMYPHVDREQKGFLWGILESKISRKEMNPLPLVAWIKYAIKENKTELLESAHRLSPDSSKWTAAIDVLAAQQKDIGKSLIQWLLTRDSSQQTKWTEKFWSLYPEDPDSVVFALALLSSQPEEKFLRYLYQKQISNELIEIALEESPVPKAIHLLVQHHLDHHQDTKAKLLIENNLQLDLLKSVTARLFPREEDWLEAMYRRVIGEYLNQHIGPVPAGKVRNILAYLVFVKARSLAVRINHWIKKEYSDHYSLLENVAAGLI
jgi:hypothetical protein